MSNTPNHREHRAGLFAIAHEKGWGFPEILLNSVERFSERPAVKSEDGELSYRQLLQHSLLVADRLNALGIGVGDRVAVCVNRDHHLPALLLGVGIVGAAYVPVDPAFPAERIRIILEDADASAAIFEPSTSDLLQGIPDLVLLDKYKVAEAGDDVFAKSLDDLRDSYVSFRGSLENAADLIAYIIFTSGSTGRPKGVPIAQSAVINFLYGVDEAIGTRDGDRFLGLTTISFDISVLELFLPLILGGVVYVCKKSDALSPDRLGAIIAKNEINVLQATPATWRLMLELGWRPRNTHKILCGGEAFPVDLAGKLLKEAGEVWNMYGPTEATVWVCSHKVSQKDISAGFIPLGAPYANVDLVVVDENLNPVAGEAAGELLIGGACLSPGYFRRPELNKDRFVALNFSGSFQSYYRTGDLVQIVGGQMRYVDRLDNQVKIRGFRIELGEIEAALTRLPEIADAAVVAVSNPAGDNVLVGCLRFSREALAFGEVENSLRQTLPFYMVPGLWRIYDSFPQTPNKKIDKKALKGDVEKGMASSILADRLFSSDMERRLASAWKAVLGVSPQDVHDHFNELGGHSLASARLSNEIEIEFGKSIGVNQLIACPVFIEQCELVTAAPEAKSHSDLITLEECAELSDGQRRIWFICQLAGSSSVFNESEAFILESPWDVGRLERAISLLLREHPVLRLKLNVANLSWSLCSGVETPLQVRDIASSSDSLEALLHQEAKREFDFDAELLVRFVAYEREGRISALQMVTHHILLDGISQLKVWDRLLQLYEGGETLVASQDSEAGAKGVIVSPRRGDLEESVEFWVQTLRKPLPLLSLRTDYERPDFFDFKGRQIVEVLGQDLSSRLIDVANKLRTRPFVVLISAFSAWLRKATGAHDLILGTATSGREGQKGLHDAIGMFFNTIPLRLPEVVGGLQEQLKSTEQALNLALLHGGISFEKIVSSIQAARDASRPTLAQAYITFNDFSNRKLNVADSGALSPVPVDIGYTQGEVFLYVDFYGGDFVFRFQTSTALFNLDTSRKMLAAYMATLKSFIESMEIGGAALSSDVSIDYFSGTIDTGGAEGRRQTRLHDGEDKELLNKVGAIWKSVLGLDELDLDANFFEVGGHSIKALQVFDQLHRRYGINAPLALLFKAPTVRSLAGELARINTSYSESGVEKNNYAVREGEGWKNIVQLSAGGAKTPLVCIHPVGGNVLAYKALLDFDDLNRPVYGIQATGLDGISEPSYSILDMARHYAALLDELLSKKQVLLLGGSMGGSIAVELANELSGRGFKVDWVILLDTIGPEAKHLPEGFAEDRRTFLQKVAQSTSARIRYYKNFLEVRFYRMLGIRMPQTLRVFEVRRSNRLAVERHIERAYNGSVMLLRLPSTESGAYSLPVLGWERHLTGRVEVETVDAEHAHFLESEEAKRVLACFLREQE
ncbi:amino acid adenylation domain-containing protein [Hahella sp. KA22]|uniref:non-ribosomal peptide synthetase n=1 Tax=Hahella sp. KA22 TaxID=1628392 RepID=UPI000FDDC6DA|nr:non-ribosomal peptide synthetase [Hahella sp. KA22]AZZ93000.1 amino acid adenylation domain-containing protein [Hahella sp. KA22]QAY56374.1 amino acid adenylation domain-containing protein [Hahella sp. KA22]